MFQSQNVAAGRPCWIAPAVVDISMQARKRPLDGALNVAVLDWVEVDAATRSHLRKLFPLQRRKPAVSPAESRGLNKERP